MLNPWKKTYRTYLTQQFSLLTSPLATSSHCPVDLNRLYDDVKRYSCTPRNYSVNLREELRTTNAVFFPRCLLVKRCGGNCGCGTDSWNTGCTCQASKTTLKLHEVRPILVDRWFEEEKQLSNNIPSRQRISCYIEVTDQYILYAAIFWLKGYIASSTCHLCNITFVFLLSQMGMIRVIAVLPFSGLKPFKKKKRMTSTHSPLSSNVVPGPVCGQCLVPEPVSSVSADKEQLLGGITAIKQWQHRSHHYLKKKKNSKQSHLMGV